MATQLARQRERNAHQRCVWQRPLHFKIWPPIRKPLDRRLFGDVERVLIGLIDFGEGLDQIDRVGFIPGEPGAN